MYDLISRAAAIDALDEIESEVADGYGYQYEKWRKYFCELPSAQPYDYSDGYADGYKQGRKDAQPQRTGKWIDCDGGIATCSACGDRWGVYGVMKFCPNCGAKMKEGEADEC